MRGRWAAACVLVGALALFSARTTPVGAGGYKVVVERLGRGVKYIKIRDPRGPWRIKVLKIDLSRKSTMDVALAADRLPGFETTSSMALRHGALVAINGDYARPSGRPVFAFAVDGQLAQTPLGWGRNFSVDAGESRTFIGHPRVKVDVAETGLVPVEIRRVNDLAGFDAEPRADEIAAFSPVGGSDGAPPNDACSARLQPLSGPSLDPAQGRVEVQHLIRRVRCREAPLRRRSRVVLAAPREASAGATVASLHEGATATMSWSLGWPGVLDTVGGNPTLIEDGVVPPANVVGDTTFFKRHPRTGVGTTPEGKVLLVTVDGRQRGWSVGMTVEEFAALFEALGATWALNLDGGGSTTMVVEDRVVNRPSDGPERPVSSAVLVLPAADKGEADVVAPVPPVTGAAASWDAIAADGASTGGLADAAASEGRPLPGFLRAADRRFDRSR